MATSGTLENWEGCVICSIYLRQYMKRSVELSSITLSRALLVCGGY